MWQSVMSKLMILSFISGFMISCLISCNNYTIKAIAATYLGIVTLIFPFYWYMVGRR